MEPFLRGNLTETDCENCVSVSMYEYYNEYQMTLKFKQGNKLEILFEPERYINFSKPAIWNTFNEVFPQLETLQITTRFMADSWRPFRFRFQDLPFANLKELELPFWGDDAVLFLKSHPSVQKIQMPGIDNYCADEPVPESITRIHFDYVYDEFDPRRLLSICGSRMKRIRISCSDIDLVPRERRLWDFYTFRGSVIATNLCKFSVDTGSI